MMSRMNSREVIHMYSQEYEKAKKEFINCLVMGPVGLFVPFVLAFKEWWPIMKREKQKAMAQENPELESSTVSMDRR